MTEDYVDAGGLIGGTEEWEVNVRVTKNFPEEIQDMRITYLDEGEWWCAECGEVGGPEWDYSIQDHYKNEHGWPPDRQPIGTKKLE